MSTWARVSLITHGVAALGAWFTGLLALLPLVGLLLGKWDWTVAPLPICLLMLGTAGMLLRLHYPLFV